VKRPGDVSWGVGKEMVLHPLHHPFHHGASPKMHDGAAPSPAAVPAAVPPAYGDYLMVAGIAGGVCAFGVFVRVIMGRRMKKTETKQGYTGYGSTPIREVHEMDQQGEFREVGWHDVLRTPQDCICVVCRWSP
jgi:hypothetical protein